MKTLKKFDVIAMAGLAALLFCGCERGPSLSELEAKERSSRLFSNAMDDLNAGRTDPAIAGFERVVRQEPSSYSAHFQLATLLQDVRKDYVGAIAHYREYLAMRPASDKATVAQERMKICETLLSAEILRKAGGSVSDKLAAANERLTNENTALSARVKKLDAELARTKKDLDLAKGDRDRFRALLSKMSADDLKPAPDRAQSAKEALAELRKIEAEEKRRRVNPTDAELLDDDETPPSALGSRGDVKKMKDDLAKEEAEDGKKPESKKMGGKPGGGVDALGTLLSGQGREKAKGVARPEKYVVQAGDTLYSISKRFYGSNAKWHEIQSANRLVIPANGRLRVGQEIKLP